MESTKGSYNSAVLKFILFSGIGAIMFFVNVDIGGVSVIPIQHIKMCIRDRYCGVFNQKISVFCVICIFPFGL